jgi:hypothetical protein
MSKPVITVFGATGVQASGLARALLAANKSRIPLAKAA